MRKESVVENKYTIRQTDKTLTTKILGSDLERMKRNQAVFDENFLNHWIDEGKYQGSDDEIVLSTQLADDETTVSEYRSSVMNSDLEEFKDKMIPVMQACLEFAYYQERSKQWKTPLNPLNLIYRTDETGKGHISAFYREPQVRKTIDSNFLDDTVKLVTYLFIPEEEDSIEKYPEMTAQKYIDNLSSSIDFDEMYGDAGDDLVEFICTCLSPRNESGTFSSVKDIMENISDFDDINQVDNPNNHGAIPEGALNDTVNLNDYQKEPDVVPEVKDPEPKMSDKELKKKKQEEELKKQQEELERKRKEKEKAKAEKKRKKAEEKAKRKKEQEERLRQQQEELEKKDKEKKSTDSPKKKKSKLPLILLAACVIGGGWYFMNSKKDTKTSEPKQETKSVSSSTKKTEDPDDNKYFKAGKDAAANSDYKKASSEFDEYFNNGGTDSDLSNEQISMVFNSYLRSGEYQKILDNIGNDDTATALVNYLTSQNQLDKVNDLYSSEPIISFVKADNQKDYEKMVDLSSKVTLSKNKKLQDDLCNAFAQTNKLQQGKEWAQDQSNSTDLINAIKAHAYQANKMSHNDIDKALS